MDVPWFLYIINLSLELIEALLLRPVRLSGRGTVLYEGDRLDVRRQLGQSATGHY